MGFRATTKLLMKSLHPILSATFFALVIPAHASEIGSVESFLEPFEHLHFSPAGTPIVHSFGIEPAFTGRDLFLNQTWQKNGDTDQYETEIELEWAFTHRLGVILEVPYFYEKTKGAKSASGFGDLAIVPRARLIDSERFMLTGQLEATLPTGSSNFGGETALAPGFSVWNDLGNWFTLNSQFGIEHTFDEDSTEFFFGLGLVKSFGEKPDSHQDHSHHAHDHADDSPNLLHLHLELTGSTPLNGDDRGVIELAGLIGISYEISQATDLRLAYQFPLTSPKEFNHAITSGLIFHF